MAGKGDGGLILGSILGRPHNAMMYFRRQLSWISIQVENKPSSITLKSEMDIIKDSTEWALALGVKLNGIAAHRFPGRGLGIIAQRNLQVGATLITIPTYAIRTFQTVPESILKNIGASSVHGTIAAELAIDTSKAHAPWRAVLPSKEDFKSSMPMMWPDRLHSLLPPASLSLVEKQKRKSSADWTAVSFAFPALDYDLYLYNWLLVSTRTFYYTTTEMEAQGPLDPDDCLALIPFADYFNHADTGCRVTFSPSGYEICADRTFKKGEELYISYGNHSNDFLLAEYGFILSENKWDEISLDEVILPLFSKGQKQNLKEAGFLGGFMLDRETVCYRTQVALRLLCMPRATWHRLRARGFEEGDKYQRAANELLSKALKAFLDIVHERLQQVSVAECGLPSQRETLRTRWEQIQLLLTTAVSRIED